MKTVTNQHIETVPEKCGGKPVIAGTRIRVWDIYVYHELQGKTADEIIAAFPHITLADVHAALAYYYDHKEARRSGDQEWTNQLTNDGGSCIYESHMASP